MKHAFFILLVILACPAQAELLVKKQRFELENFVTFGGKTIPHIAVGWESYGALNADKSNTILITHYFTGTSHAAGKYHPDDPQPGYWDAIIGPGKAIDTNKYFVVSVDTLVNLNVGDPNVITTGPASIDPRTNKPYGLTFPVVTIRDFVNVQKALLESLDIRQLHAVAGPSMGSMQAIDWASTYPDWVSRMISVIGTAQADAWTVPTLEQWAMPIRLDVNWKQGNYYSTRPPTEGLTASLMLLTQVALHPEFFINVGQSIGFSPLEPQPLQDINQQHSIVNWLRTRAQARASLMDANHMLYLVRANQLFIAGHNNNLKNGLDNIKAKTLFIAADKDLLLMPYLAKQAHMGMLSQGNQSEWQSLSGSAGHLEGVINLAEKADQIKAFLAK